MNHLGESVDLARFERVWIEEPPAADDTRFITWAEPGWHSWNLASPEVEFCEFVASVVTMTRPRLVVETGTGQGFVTRRVAASLYEGCRLLTFEQDDDLRAKLSQLPFFTGDRIRLAAKGSPTADDLEQAELTILDSDGSLRLTELQVWWQAAPPGAVIVAHDAGNGHPDCSHHARLAGLIRELGIPGIFFRNARGSFLGVRPGRLPVSRTAPPELHHWYENR